MTGWNDLPFEVKSIILEHCIWNALAKGYQRRECSQELQAESFSDLFNLTTVDPGMRNEVIKIAVEIKSVCQRLMLSELRHYTIVGLGGMSFPVEDISKREMRKAMRVSKLLRRGWEWCTLHWLEEDDNDDDWTTDESDQGGNHKGEEVMLARDECRQVARNTKRHRMCTICRSW